VVENYLPGALKKYKMDYATLSKINPKLIYASITGYGQTGPNASRAGYDVMVEAYVLPSSPLTNPPLTQSIGYTEKWASCTLPATATRPQPKSA
jgi:hypothetical protein